MVIQFILILLIFQLSGDILLQLKKIKLYRKIEKFTLLEHFVFSLVLGLILNTFFTLIEVIFTPFNLILLILINIGFILFNFAINKDMFNTFFYSRLVRVIKIKGFTYESKKYYYKFIIYIILISVLDIYFSSLFYQLEFQDLLTYSHYALDSIRNGWNLYDEMFLIGPYNTNIFTFLIIPFYSISPSNWLIISGIYLSKLQFYLFFTLIFISLHRYNSKINPIIVPLIYMSTLYLPSWFYYFLPSNFNLILVLMLVQFLFNKEIRSLFIGFLLFIFIIMFHLPSSLLMFGIPLFFTCLLYYRKEKNYFLNFKRFKRKFKKIWIKSPSFKYTIMISIGIFVILLIMIIIIIWSTFIWIWNNYLMLSIPEEKVKPVWLVWNDFTLGLYIIIPILILLGIFIYRNRNLDYQKYILFFFFILSIYISIIISNFNFWRLIFRSRYPEYRFMIYLDFSLILLIPIFLFDFKNQIEKLYHKVKGLSNHKIKIMFLKGTYISLITFFFSSFAINIQSNYRQNYKHDYFADFWPDGYYNATLFLKTQNLLNATYMFNPNGKVFTADWNFFHTFLGDTRCIDLEQIKPYYNDSLYSSENPNHLSEYQSFLHFIFNETKNINPLQANYKNLPDDLKKTKIINYIFIDSLSNENLCNFLLNDTFYFKLIYKDITVYDRFKNVYLFETEYLN